MIQMAQRISRKYLKNVVACPVALIPKRFAVYAPAPVIVASAMPKICDKDVTDPITSSGEGIATDVPAVKKIKRPASQNRVAIVGKTLSAKTNTPFTMRTITNGTDISQRGKLFVN
mgnify:CR=1 FL=1